MEPLPVEAYCSCVGCGVGSSEPRLSEELQPLFAQAAADAWTWDPDDKSQEVTLYGTGNATAMFHPGWSNGTAAVKGTSAVNGSRRYWEIQVSHRVFGTSIMFGVSAKDTKNFRGFFTNLVGADELSWGLSHKGLIWHNGKSQEYTAPFPENTPTRIGVLFDGFEGSLRFFKDGVDLGVAFRGLHKVDFPLFPIVASTAARSELWLTRRVRLGFPSLEALCAMAVAERTALEDLPRLPLPPHLRSALRKRVLAGAPVTRRSPYERTPCPLETKSYFP